MLPVTISSSSSDESSLKLLSSTLFITSTSSSDSPINCFNKTFFSDLDFFLSVSVYLLIFCSNSFNIDSWETTLTKSYITALLLIANHTVELIWTDHTGYISVCIHILYVDIYSNLVPRTFWFSNIGRRERSSLPILERQDALGMRLYIKQYIWIFYLSS